MVQVILHGPEWFLGLDAMLEGATAIIALLVCIAAFRAFLLTKQRNLLAFSGCFALLSASFGVRAITDIVIEKFVPSARVFLYGYMAHIMLAVDAYLALIIITQKIRQPSTKLLLYALALPALLVSGSYFLSFYGVSFILLAFIAFAYFKNCKRACTMPSYLVFLSFLLIALAQPMFLLEVYAKEWYVAAHVTQFIGYFLLLATLALVHKK